LIKSKCFFLLSELLIKLVFSYSDKKNNRIIFPKEKRTKKESLPGKVRLEGLSGLPVIFLPIKIK